MAKMWQAVLLVALTVPALSLSVDKASPEKVTDHHATAVKACEACSMSYLAGVCYFGACEDGSGFCYRTAASSGYEPCWESTIGPSTGRGKAGA
mmetsp:Transcript_6822/g.18206  ORF Transcript_6822/g.18206 Transcript_6822/m.18206 type:complete len:94 (-) Transcript_6822:157-438(-)